MEETLYRIIFDTIKEPVVIVDKTRIIDSNKAFLDLIGSDRQTPAQDLASYFPFIAQILTCGDHTELQMPHPAGMQLNLEAHCSCINTEAGIYLIELRKSQNENRYHEMTLLANHMRDMFALFPDAVVILDNQDRIVDANRGFERLFGYSRREYLGEDIDKLIVPPEERAEAKLLIHAVHRSKQLQIDLRRLTKSGQPVDVHATAYPVMIDHITSGNYVIYKDLRQQKETERKLVEQQAFFEQLFNNSLFPIAILDQEEHILDANRQFIDFFGYDKADLLGKDINKLIVPHQCEEESKIFRTRVFQKSSMSARTLRMNAAGELMAVEAVGSPVIIDNEVKGMFAMYRDIRIEEQALQELKTEKAYFQQLFDNTPSAVVLTDQHDRIKQVNKPFEQLFGYSREELLGGDLNELIVSDSQRHEAVNYSRSVIDRGQCIETETTRSRKDGSPVEVSIIAFPILLDQNHLGAYVIYMDIRERRRREREIEKLLNTDPLTGLFNRKYAYEKLAEYLLDSQKDTGPECTPRNLAVIYIDLDRFKEINDEKGHQAGDEILKAFAGHMKEHWGGAMDICRVGGDEFVCLIRHESADPATAQTAKEWSALVKNSFARPVAANGFSAEIKLSIGWADWPQDGHTVDQLISAADARMYTNKKIGRIKGNPVRRQISLNEIEQLD